MHRHFGILTGQKLTGILAVAWVSSWNNQHAWKIISASFGGTNLKPPDTPPRGD